jgi:hypothetical protein
MIDEYADFPDIVQSNPQADEYAAFPDAQPQETAPAGLLDRIKQDISKATNESTKLQARTDINPMQRTLSNVAGGMRLGGNLVGTGLGGVTDVIGNLLAMSATPAGENMIENVAGGYKNVGEKIGSVKDYLTNTQPVRAVTREAQNISVQNPKAAQTLSDVKDIVVNAPFVGGGSKVAGKGLELAGGMVGAGAENAIVKNTLKKAVNLVTPDVTASAIKRADRHDITTTGTFLKKTAIKLSPVQQEAVKAVAEIPNIDKGSLVNNLQKITNAGDELGNHFRAALTVENKSYNLPQFEVGVNQALQGVKFEPVHIDEFHRILDKHPKTLVGLHDARIEFDKYLNGKGKIADYAVQSETSKAIRDYTNNFIDSNVQGENLRAIRAKQHALFVGGDAVQAKIAKSAQVHGGMVGAVKRGVSNAVMAHKAATLATLSAGGALLGGATAPIGMAGLAGYGAYKAGQAVMNPKLRKGLGALLKTTGKGLQGKIK